MTSGLALSRLHQFSTRLQSVEQVQHIRAEHHGSDPKLEGLRGRRCRKIATRTPWRVRGASQPAPYYTTLAGCATKDVPFTGLASDLSSGPLPAFSFITPNLIHDMHDGTIAQGDVGSRDTCPPILNSSEYRSGRTVVFITWDEGEGGTSNDCATNTTDVGCHVATIVISPRPSPEPGPGCCSTTIRCSDHGGTASLAAARRSDDSQQHVGGIQPLREQTCDRRPSQSGWRSHSSPLATRRCVRGACTRPATGPALAFLQLLLCPPNAALSGSPLLGILDPADELVAGQGRDVLPDIECRGVGDQRLTQVRRQLVHHPTRQSLATHRPNCI